MSISLDRKESCLLETKLEFSLKNVHEERNYGKIYNRDGLRMSSAQNFELHSLQSMTSCERGKMLTKNEEIN